MLIFDFGIAVHLIDSVRYMNLNVLSVVNVPNETIFCPSNYILNVLPLATSFFNLSDNFRFPLAKWIRTLRHTTNRTIELFENELLSDIRCDCEFNWRLTGIFFV